MIAPERRWKASRAGALLALPAVLEPAIAAARAARPDDWRAALHPEQRDLLEGAEKLGYRPSEA